MSVDVDLSVRFKMKFYILYSYSPDVQQKIVEAHKIESGHKKIANALKTPISTIRAIWLFNIWICLEEDMVSILS